MDNLFYLVLDIFFKWLHSKIAYKSYRGALLVEEHYSCEQGFARRGYFKTIVWLNLS